jgi:hypothetical protein
MKRSLKRDRYHATIGDTEREEATRSVLGKGRDTERNRIRVDRE